MNLGIFIAEEVFSNSKPETRDMLQTNEKEFVESSKSSVANFIADFPNENLMQSN